MPNVKLSFGPMLIGVFINMILYGVLLMQTLTYVQLYKRDIRWIQALVAYLFIVETANTVFDMLIMYEPLILNYGLPEATKFFPKFFVTEPLVIVGVAFPIQLFFAWRIWFFTKSPWVPIVVTLLAMVSLGGGIWTAIGVATVKVFARKPELHTPALVWFLTACAADVIITVAMVVTLSRRKTGITVTDDVISKIIRITVQTGMLTAFFAIGDVVFFMTLERTALNFIWDLALSKLYANCLMSSLNARATLKEQTTGVSGVSRQTAPSSSRKFEFEPPMSPRGVRNPTYELDTQLPKALQVESSFVPDVEYGVGVTVTKTVERHDGGTPTLRYGDPYKPQGNYAYYG